jgi:unsaturated rhamnogalacturonyl hydrolase
MPGQATRATMAGGDAVLLGRAQPGQPFVHYLGAGWSKSGDYPDAAAWEAQVRNVAARLATPLEITR